jgi:hypothetical protein
MENTNKNKKSNFIHKTKIHDLKDGQIIYLNNLKKIINGDSELEIIGYIPNHVSEDEKFKPMVLSLVILNKIQIDHDNICPENIILNIDEWDFYITNVDNKPDRINLIKIIPDSDNYLLIAANRDNGYYIVTHFETESKNGNNLKRLLKRGNVLNRVSSVA